VIEISFHGLNMFLEAIIASYSALPLHDSVVRGAHDYADRMFQRD
jgi:hypothetical protein